MVIGWLVEVWNGKPLPLKVVRLGEISSYLVIIGLNWPPILSSQKSKYTHMNRVVAGDMVSRMKMGY